MRAATDQKRYYKGCRLGHRQGRGFHIRLIVQERRDNLSRDILGGERLNHSIGSGPAPGVAPSAVSDDQQTGTLEVERGVPGNCGHPLPNQFEQSGMSTDRASLGEADGRKPVAGSEGSRQDLAGVVPLTGEERNHQHTPSVEPVERLGEPWLTLMEPGIHFVRDSAACQVGGEAFDASVRRRIPLGAMGCEQDGSVNTHRESWSWTSGAVGVSRPVMDCRGVSRPSRRW